MLLLFCPDHLLNTDKFKTVVINQLKQKILTPVNLRKLGELPDEGLDTNRHKYRFDLNNIAKAIQDTNQRIERIYDALETGKIGLDDLVDRIKQLRERQDELDTKRLEIEAAMSDRKVEPIDLKTMTAYVEDIREVLMAGTLTERRSFIRNFVKEIKRTGDEFPVTYTPPIPAEQIELEKLAVPRFVQRGGQQQT